jgi:HSP20 family protein
LAYITFRQTNDELANRQEFTGILQNSDERLKSEKENTKMANLTRYNPFNEVISLRDAMDRLFEDSFIPRAMNNFVGRGVAANLFETPEGFILQVPMPGVSPEAVEITAQQDTLSLKWETKTTIPESATVHWHGFQQGHLQQTFTLPAAINSERAEASYADGILTLNLPKAEHVKARTVKVVAKK